ncbi:MAG: tyrosine-protein phosphatase [Acidimicrobiales bacterium]
MQPASNLPALSGVLNFRDMAGLRGRLEGQPAVIAPGRLLRSGHLAAATDDDVEALAGLGLHSVVDFRQDVDKRGDGGDDRLPDGVRLIENPVPDPAGAGAEIRELLMSGDTDRINARYGNGQAAELAKGHAVAQATEPDKHAVYAAFLAHLLEADGPVLFHCSAGKDRAGWAATVAGMALGVDDDQLIEHYLLSNVHRPAAQRLAYFASKGIDAEVMRPFLQVDDAYLRAALAAVDEGWASRDDYLADALGVGSAEREALRARYLEAA